MSVIAELTAKLGFEVHDEPLEHMRHKIDGIAESVKVLVGFEIAEKLFHLVHSMAGFGETLENAAIQAGITTDELQKLQYAASQNAITANELTQGINRLSRVLFQAQKGSKSATDAFARLGIDREQLASFTNVTDALYAVQDGIGGISTQQEKLGVIMQLFGRGGAKYLKFMQSGSEATKAFGEEAERVGAIVSKDNVEGLAKFEVASISLGQVIKSVFATIAGTIAPAFTKSIKELQNAWASSRGGFAAGLKALAGGFAYYMGIAIVLLRELSATVHAVVNGDGGIVGIVKKGATVIIAVVGALGQFVFDFFASINKNKDVEKAFDSIVGLLTSVLALVNELLASLLNLMGVFGGQKIPLGPWEAVAVFFRSFAFTVATVADGFKNLANWTNFALKGGFGDLLGEKIFGDSGAGVKSIRSVGQQAAATQSLAAGLGVASVLPQAVATKAQDASKMPLSVSVTSPITVNAAPGMDERALADMVSKKQGKTLLDALNEADRDFSYGHSY